MIKKGDLVKRKGDEQTKDFGNVFKVSLESGKAYVSFYHVRSCHRTEGWVFIDDLIKLDKQP
jgi:hypothetical protein